MEQTNLEIITTSTFIVFLIIVGIVLLFSIFEKRKNQLLKEQEKNKEDFERHIAETQIEIREEKLKNISWELHDNISQLLTLAKIQLQSFTKENIKDVSETITKGLIEVRALSKLINADAIKNINLQEAVQLEIDRFNRLNFIDGSLIILGNETAIDKKHSLILFRILQDFFSNTIKYSRASTLKVSLDYKIEHLIITAKENGAGFLSGIKKDGIGLSNIRNRVKLIGAEALFSSEKNRGTTLQIQYKL